MKPLKVMIADDNPFFRKMLACQLESAGYDVWTVNDGVDALQLVGHLEPDLVITDEIMPRITGIELCSRIRPSFGVGRGPFTIVMTASPESDNPFHARDLGVDLYVSKKQLSGLLDRNLLRAECLSSEFREVFRTLKPQSVTGEKSHEHLAMCA